MTVNGAHLARRGGAHHLTAGKVPRNERALANGSAAREMRWPFLVGLLAFAHVDILGQLYLVEVVFALLGAQSLLGRPAAGRTPQDRLRIMYGAGAILLYIILLTQLWTGGDLQSTAKAVLLYAFLLVNVIGLWRVLDGDVSRAKALVVGLLLGTALQLLVQPTSFQRDVPWKFGFAYPALLLVAVIASSRRSQRFAPMLFILLAVVNVALNTRSLAILCVAIAGVLLLRGRGPSAERVGLSLFLLPLVASVAYGGYLAYAHYASTGLMGQEVQQKYFMQSEGRWGLLVGGRPEIFYTATAIADSPLIGRGYAPPLTPELAAAGRAGLRDAGYLQVAGQALEEGRVPMHSYVLGAWVMFGAAGFVFWMVVLALVARSLLESVSKNSRHLPMAMTGGCLLLWNALFSPFGAEARFSAALCICLAFLVPANGDPRMSAR